MNYSDFQKNILKFIHDKKSIDLDFFLQKFCNVKIGKSNNIYGGLSKHGTSFRINQGCDIYYFPVDEILQIEKVKTFIQLLEKLDRLNLIIIEQASPSEMKFIPIYKNDCNGPNQNISNLWEDWFDRKINSIEPDLAEFINRDFKTFDEYKVEHEKRTSQASLIINKRNLIASIVIGIIAIGLTSYQVFFHNRNENEISITKTNELLINKKTNINSVSIPTKSSKCIYNPFVKKYLGVHKNGELVMWNNCSSGEKWNIQSNGCIYNHFVKKYLGVHENGELVMWDNCSSGEKWNIQNNGCIYNHLVKKYLGLHENGELVMWDNCSSGEKWNIQ